MLKKVLIVDDSRLARLTLRRLLSKHQLDVHEVEGVLDAEEWLARNELPDVVFMDIMMPQLDGYAGLARLRENPETRHIPVIMYSGDISEEARQKARDSGATGYLPKPAEGSRLDNLLNSLSQRLDERPAQAVVEQRPAPSPTPAPAAAPVTSTLSFGSEGLAPLGKRAGSASPATATAAPVAAPVTPAAPSVALEEFKALQQRNQSVEDEIRQLKMLLQQLQGQLQQQAQFQPQERGLDERSLERLQEIEQRLGHIERKPQIDGNSERLQRDIVFLQRQLARIDTLAKGSIAAAVVALLFSILVLVMQFMGS